MYNKCIYAYSFTPESWPLSCYQHTVDWMLYGLKTSLRNSASWSQPSFRFVGAHKEIKKFYKEWFDLKTIMKTLERITVVVLWL